MSTAGVRVTVVTTAVLECKDADDVDHEAEDRYHKKSLVMDFRRLKQTLQPESHQITTYRQNHKIQHGPKKVGPVMAIMYNN